MRWFPIIALGAALLTNLGGSVAGSMAAAHPETLAASSGRIFLGSDSVRVRLVASSTALRQRLASLDTERVFLVLGDLEAAAQPGVIYEIYLGLPQGTMPSVTDPHFVGTLSFFAIAPPNTAPQERRYDVTQQVGALLLRGLPEQDLAVTIAPAAGMALASETPPTVGRIALVAQ